MEKRHYWSGTRGSKTSCGLLVGYTNGITAQTQKTSNRLSEVDCIKCRKIINKRMSRITISPYPQMFLQNWRHNSIKPLMIKSLEGEIGAAYSQSDGDEDTNKWAEDLNETLERVKTNKTLSKTDWTSISQCIENELQDRNAITLDEKEKNTARSVIQKIYKLLK